METARNRWLKKIPEILVGAEMFSSDAKGPRCLPKTSNCARVDCLVFNMRLMSRDRCQLPDACVQLCLRVQRNENTITGE